MSKESTRLLLSATAGSFISEKQKGSGYHQHQDNLHTFVVSFKSWQGELTLQATLALYPNDTTDWFTIKDLDNNKAVFDQDSSDWDDSYTVNSEGKFVWIRAVGRVDQGEIAEIRYIY